MKKNLLFVISQFYKGGAEISLRNLLLQLDYTILNVDFLIMNQCPIEGAFSLIQDIPKEVNVCDVYMQNQKKSIWRKVKASKLYQDAVYSKFPIPALDFVRNKKYDCVFHVGEWNSPAFVAQCVTADIKAAWIHNDLSKAEYFDAEHYFHFFESFTYYIFVSQKSMLDSIGAYPFLKGKSYVIYNINNVMDIKAKANEEVTDMQHSDVILVTCANVRPQKNYCRQIEAMKLLKERGAKIKWINIGSQADKHELSKVNFLIHKYDLEKDFILLGARDNPYKYMTHATAITVLSDYESWSMVITEAKILGVPVIATRTSGALEQIEDGVTGILTDFTAKDIADKIEVFVTNKSQQESIKSNIANFDNTESILQSFYGLLEERIPVQNKDILYIIDDINYAGGAHGATKRQIEYLLSNNKQLSIFSTSIPSLETRLQLQGVCFFNWNHIKEYFIYNKRLLDVLTSRIYTLQEKQLKIRMTFDGRVKKKISVFQDYVLPGYVFLFGCFKTVVIMSEASSFRKQVALCTAEKKIQWIHTDYNSWSQWDKWTQEITQNDSEIYSKFTKIVLLSQTIKEEFDARYPELSSKTIVVRNILPYDVVLKKSLRNHSYPKSHFVTVGRLSKEKALPRLIEVLHKLDEEGYDFSLDIIGNGPEWQEIKQSIEGYGLSDKIHMLGTRSNPFALMREADVFLLVSKYEGLPNTIYEALVLGTPVLATKVGGIPDQIQPNYNGWLVENNQEGIYKGIKYVLEHRNEIAIYKKNLANYKYDNQEIYSKINYLFD